MNGVLKTQPQEEGPGYNQLLDFIKSSSIKMPEQQQMIHRQLSPQKSYELNQVLKNSNDFANASLTYSHGSRKDPTESLQDMNLLQPDGNSLGQYHQLTDSLGDRQNALFLS